MKNKWTLLFLFIPIILIAGCSTSTTQNQIVCNNPYIQIGTECCLDQNNNGICDRDDASKPSTITETYIPKIEINPNNLNFLINQPNTYSGDYYKTIIIGNSGERGFNFNVSCDRSQLINFISCYFCPDGIKTENSITGCIGGRGYSTGILKSGKSGTILIKVLFLPKDKDGSYFSQLTISDKDSNYINSIPIQIDAKHTE